MASVPNISHPAGLSVCRTIWTENTDSESTEKGFESKITDFTVTKCEACIQKTKCRKKTTLYSMSLLWTLGNNCWGSGAASPPPEDKRSSRPPPLHYRGHGEAAFQKKKKSLKKKNMAALISSSHGLSPAAITPAPVSCLSWPAQVLRSYSLAKKKKKRANFDSRLLLWILRRGIKRLREGDKVLDSN